jgi:hypothetical protein
MSKRVFAEHKLLLRKAAARTIDAFAAAAGQSLKAYIPQANHPKNARSNGRPPQALSNVRRNVRSKNRAIAMRQVANQKTYQTSSRSLGYPS